MRRRFLTGFENFFRTRPYDIDNNLLPSAKSIDKMAKEAPARTGLIVGINKGHVR